MNKSLFLPSEDSFTEIDSSPDIIIPPSEPTVAVLGFFDGFHIGHAALLKTAKRIADSEKLKLCVWTLRFSSGIGKGALPKLCTENEKFRLLKEAGADRCVCSCFDDIKDMSGADFIDNIAVKKLSARHIVCGENFVFGAGASCGTAFLERHCRENSIGLSVVPLTRIGNTPVSSSAIRDCISIGDFSRAEKMLGRPFSLSGAVSHGKGLGKDLGFPTANQIFPPDTALPSPGVYITNARLVFDGEEKYLPSLTNVGPSPSFPGNDGTPSSICETYIPSFGGSLYGESITLVFVRKIRCEMKFLSREAFEEQLKTDISLLKTYTDGKNI